MTNETIESIMTTRAMRRYTDEAVTDDHIRTCLRAAQQAPSGGNVQPQQYVVVTDPRLWSRWWGRGKVVLIRQPDGTVSLHLPTPDPRLPPLTLPDTASPPSPATDSSSR